VHTGGVAFKRRAAGYERRMYIGIGALIIIIILVIILL
jgi:hypothetical protein